LSVKFLGYEDGGSAAWWLPYHDRNECTIVPLEDGEFGALDNGVQTLVATSRSRAELVEWIGDNYYDQEDDGLDELTVALAARAAKNKNLQPYLKIRGIKQPGETRRAAGYYTNEEGEKTWGEGYMYADGWILYFDRYGGQTCVEKID
jgi:hypothetical protein